LSMLLLLLLLFLGLALAGLDTPLPLPSQVRSSRSQEDRECPRGASPPTGLGHFRGLYPWGHTQAMPQHRVPFVMLYLTPRTSPGWVSGGWKSVQRKTVLPHVNFHALYQV
jgi:hypothetical protein